MCIYTVTKAEVGSLRCGVDVTACLTYLNENLSLCEIHHYIQWVYVNMNFKKEVTQNQSSFHSSRRFWSTAFPNPLSELFSVCSHGSSALVAMRALHVSVSVALSSIWRVQQFCECSSLLWCLSWFFKWHSVFQYTIQSFLITRCEVWARGTMAGRPLGCVVGCERHSFVFYS